MHNALKAIGNDVSQYQTKTSQRCGVLNVKKDQLASHSGYKGEKQVPISTVGHVKRDQLTLMFQCIDVDRRNI